MVSFFKNNLFSIVLIIVLGLFYYKYKVAPKIELNQLEFEQINGREFDENQLKGKHVFVNIMATWCGPCRAELPSIEKANLLLKDYNYEFLVVSDEAPGILNRFNSRYNYSYKFLRILNNRESLGIHSVPTSYVFDPEGNILLKYTGERDWSSEENIKLLKKLSAES